jgi:catechol-2,3-dioxygenase
MFDRTTEDVCNVVELGHVNVTIPDQSLATLFYISGLGLTRDPYMMTGLDNMWVNVGRAQFHLPSRPKPQVLRGVTGLVVPDLDALRARLERVAPALKDTRFTVTDGPDGSIETTCPWGNRIRLHAPDPARFGPMTLGMPYVELHVPRDTTAGIVRFYRTVLNAHATASNGQARVFAGEGAALLFVETDEPAPAFDGHHIQITLADFSGPYRRLLDRDLVTAEDDQHQYRFCDIIDPNDGRVLFTVEHEVRSLRHPMFGRALVNRNPAQNNRQYVRGKDFWPV